MNQDRDMIRGLYISVNDQYCTPSVVMNSCVCGRDLRLVGLLCAVHYRSLTESIPLEEKRRHV